MSRIHRFRLLKPLKVNLVWIESQFFMVDILGATSVLSDYFR